MMSPSTPVFGKYCFHNLFRVLKDRFRYKKWESDRILSFVPPDGNFRLVSYHIGSGSVVSEDEC